MNAVCPVTPSLHNASMAALNQQQGASIATVIISSIAIVANILLLLTIYRTKTLRTHCWLLIAHVCDYY
jgi:hypothetical protein